nr:unnamed protein product [Callosobruchus analis]
MAAALEKTGILNTEAKLDSKSLNNIIKSICKQEARLSDTTTTMSRAEMLRKHNNYVSKLRICIRMYSDLNNVLLKEISFIRGKIYKAKLTVNELNVSIEKLQQLEQNSSKYETEVRKFEQKYPWLKDPELDLPNIAKETEKLQHLKDLKEKLSKELSKYEGLKPDIVQASQQLAAIKEENRKINIQLHN